MEELAGAGSVPLTPRRDGGCGGAGLDRHAAGEDCQPPMKIFRATAALAGLLLPRLVSV
jgi:hypothetical protein